MQNFEGFAKIIPKPKAMPQKIIIKTLLIIKLKIKFSKQSLKNKLKVEKKV